MEDEVQRNEGSQVGNQAQHRYSSGVGGPYSLYRSLGRQPLLVHFFPSPSSRGSAKALQWVLQTEGALSVIVIKPNTDDSNVVGLGVIVVALCTLPPFH